jgi:hypothetical protein
MRTPGSGPPDCAERRRIMNRLCVNSVSSAGPVYAPGRTKRSAIGLKVRGVRKGEVANSMTDASRAGNRDFKV